LQLNQRRMLLQQNWLSDFFDADSNDLVIDDFLGFYGESCNGEHANNDNNQ
jgi:hypothetical protein